MSVTTRLSPCKYSCAAPHARKAGNVGLESRKNSFSFYASAAVLLADRNVKGRQGEIPKNKRTILLFSRRELGKEQKQIPTAGVRLESISGERCVCPDFSEK